MKSKSFNLTVEWHAFTTTYHNNYLNQRLLCAAQQQNLVGDNLGLDQHEWNCGLKAIAGLKPIRLSQEVCGQEWGLLHFKLKALV